MFQANDVLKHYARRGLITIIYHQLPALASGRYHYYTQIVRLCFRLSNSPKLQPLQRDCVIQTQYFTQYMVYFDLDEYLVMRNVPMQALALKHFVQETFEENTVRFELRNV